MLTGLQHSLTFGKTSCPFVETSFTTSRSIWLKALSHTVSESLVTYTHACFVLVCVAIHAATRYHKDSYERNRRDLKIYDKQYIRVMELYMLTVMMNSKRCDDHYGYCKHCNNNTIVITSIKM